MDFKRERKSRARARRANRRNRTARGGLPASLAQSTRPGRRARIRQNGQAGGTFINHTETLGVINCKDIYEVTEYVINPGVSASFPWLSTQSGSWEYYRFTNLQVNYKPLVATTKDGIVMMAFEYSAGSPPPQDIKVIMAYQKAVNTPVYRPVSAPLDIKSAFPFSKQGGCKYVRHNTEPDDRKFYDAAVLMVATQGGLASPGTDVGVLSISYTIEFRTPQVEKPLAVTANLLSQNKQNQQTVLSSGTSAVEGIGFGDANFNTIPGATAAVLTGALGGWGFTVPKGTYRISVDNSWYSNAEAATDAAVEIYIEIGTTSDDGDSFTPLPGNPSKQYNQVLSETGSGFVHRGSISSNVLAFVTDEFTTFMVRVTATIGAVLTSGIVALFESGTFNIEKFGSQV